VGVSPVYTSYVTIIVTTTYMAYVVYIVTLRTDLEHVPIRITI